MRNKIQKFKVCAFVAFIILSALFSCTKDDFNFSKFAGPDLMPDLAAPLVHSNLSLKNLLPEGSIIVEDNINHNLMLVYETKVYSLKAEDYIQIPNQQQTFTKDQLSIPLTVGTSLTLPYDEYITFTPPVSGQRIDSIAFKSGLISLSLNSNINHNGSIEIELPFATKNGVALKTTLAHSYSGSGPVTNQVDIDLTGYTINLSTLTGGGKAIFIHFVLKVEGDNNPDLSPYSFELSALLSQLKFSKIFGYLGTYEYPMKDSVELSIFKNSYNGQIQFGDMRINLNTSNSIGMPMQLNVNELKAYSSKHAPYTVDITNNPGFVNPIHFPSPDFNHAGQTADTTYTFTPANCNLLQALNISPTYIKFDINGESNPAGNPAEENFILDTSRYSLQVRIELPLFASIAGFWVADTMNFNFSDIKRIEEFAFVMTTVNRFPLDVWIQAYFADSNNIILDSLMYSNDHFLVHAAAVGPAPDYYVPLFPEPPKYTFNPQPLDRTRLTRLASSRKLILKAGLNTYNNSLVKIYNDYNLDVRMGARIRFTY